MPLGQSERLEQPATHWPSWQTLVLSLQSRSRRHLGRMLGMQSPRSQMRSPTHSSLALHWATALGLQMPLTQTLSLPQSFGLLTLQVMEGSPPRRHRPLTQRHRVPRVQRLILAMQLAEAEHVVRGIQAPLWQRLFAGQSDAVLQALTDGSVTQSPLTQTQRPKAQTPAFRVQSLLAEHVAWGAAWQKPPLQSSPVLQLEAV